MLSPATAKKDLQEKYRLYERSGVKEYCSCRAFLPEQQAASQAGIPARTAVCSGAGIKYPEGNR
ncbi:Uma2 family endonuclease [Syntrophomonas wolfei]|uniref:Uma2 family endonuclease n=1 Tax=Syntrophomonas wolfei TaxID=863 RepID=UPI001F2FF1C9|nr:Uma2 family endonuclease [Syntrophomonas wolfei]